MEHVITFYKESLEKYQKQYEVLSRKYNQLAALRLLNFVVAVGAGIYLLVIDEPAIAAIAFTVLMLAFLYLVKRHSKIEEGRTHAGHLAEINKDEITRVTKDELEFENGSEYADLSHPYTADLDMFGRGSIYQHICRAESYMGKRLLASWLQKASSVERILERQNAVMEIKPATAFRQNLQAWGRGVSETKEDIAQIDKWLNRPYQFVSKHTLKAAIIILPVITGLTLLSSLFGVPLVFGLVMVVVQLSLVGAFLKTINNQHNEVSDIYKVFDKYSKQLELIESASFTGELLLRLQEKLKTGSEAASKSLGKLHALINALDGRANLIGALVLNGTYMRDLHVIMDLELWKKKHAESLKMWFEVIAEFEAISSLGTYAFNHPEFSMPTFRDGEPFIEAKDLGHPLIKAGNRVGNDMRLNGEGSFMLITGSNMAGKSTFLRTVGVNMVVGMAGAPVCAKEMVFTPIQLFTSMRVGDSVLNSESTFYYELKRIKEIIDRLQAGEKLFILLDEILRGTNSADKLSGSQALIRQLISLQATGIIATHDLVLAEMEDEYPAKITNYNFEVDITEDKFIFDYKLKRGPCRIKNATQLMRKMGISV